MAPTTCNLLLSCQENITEITLSVQAERELFVKSLVHFSSLTCMGRLLVSFNISLNVVLSVTRPKQTCLRRFYVDRKGLGNFTREEIVLLSYSYILGLQSEKYCLSESSLLLH